MCWATGAQHSNLWDVYWSHSLLDLNTKLKIKVGCEQAKISQEYQTISSLLALVFGGKKSNAVTPESFEQAEAQLKSVFGG